MRHPCFCETHRVHNRHHFLNLGTFLYSRGHRVTCPGLGIGGFRFPCGLRVFGARGVWGVLGENFRAELKSGRARYQGSRVAEALNLFRVWGLGFLKRLPKRKLLVQLQPADSHGHVRMMHGKLWAQDSGSQVASNRGPLETRIQWVAQVARRFRAL